MLIRKGDLVHNSWVVGILLSLFSAFSGAVGDTLIRLSLKQSPEAPNQKYWWAIWIIGLLSTHIFEELLNLAALFYAPSSLVAPIGSAHVAIVVLLSVWWLGEPISSRGIGCILICMVGVILCTVGAPKQSSEHLVLSEALVELVQGDKLLFLSSLGLVLTILLGLSWLFQRLHYKSVLVTFTPCILAGSIGGLTQLTNRMLVLVFYHVEAEGLISVLTDPAAITFVLAHLFMVVQSIYWFNKSLFSLSSAIVVPFTNSIFLITTSIGAMMIFAESADNLLLYSFSLAVIGISTAALFVIEQKRDPQPLDLPLRNTPSLSSYQKSLSHQRCSFIPGLVVDALVLPCRESTI